MLSPERRRGDAVFYVNYLLSSGSCVRVAPGTPLKLGRATACDGIAQFCHRQLESHSIGYQREESQMMTLSEALAAYRTCARAEARSPRTADVIMSSVRYFMEFLGGDPAIASITVSDFRRFTIALQETHKYRKHPFTRPQKAQRT